MTDVKSSRLYKTRKKAEKGIRSSEEHAGTSWCERASHYVRWFFRVYRKPQTMEACRLWAYTHGLEVPLEQRAWGSVTQRAIREKTIVPTGGYAKAVSSNLSPKALYLRA
jgi:hypothetical protein